MCLEYKWKAGRKIKWFFFSSVDLEIFKNLFVELIYSKIGFLWCVALSFHTHTHRFSYPPPQSGYKTISASLKTSRILCIRRRQWHPTPVLLPGKSHGQRSLVGCSPWGCKEWDTTEGLHFHTLEKGMATHSSVLSWRIPGMGEPGGLPSMGSHRVGHDWNDLAAAAAAWHSINKNILLFWFCDVCIVSLLTS